MFEAKEQVVRTLPIVVLALLLGLAGPIAARAEIVSVPPAAPPSSTEPLPPPTVLRGFPPSPPNRGPVCPPGYALSPDYGCMAPAAGEYSEGSPGYDYWPDYWYGYPGFGFPGFGHRGDRFHRSSDFRGLHHPARFGGVGVGAGHTGGFGGVGVGAGHMGGFGGVGVGAGHMSGFGRR
jgi:hypothetical protein